jgi:1,2-diacylglycerol 3-alpha-glucosyltransferase
VSAVRAENILERSAASGLAPRVAIACSGVGHIRRGNETWARTVAEALHENGVNVQLMGGGHVSGCCCPYFRIPNLPREQWVARTWVSWHHRYLIEQLSTAASLLVRRIWREFDILHVADPDLALQLQRRSRATQLRIVYKDGLNLGPLFCRHFDYVQVLAPWYREKAEDQGVDTRGWFVIPHLVNIDRFQPVQDKSKARRALGLSATADAFFALAIGDFSPASRKRLDWAVKEFARFSQDSSTHLIVAGQSSDSDFSRFEREARSILGDRVHLFRNLPPDEVAAIYQTADVFIHAALQEPFGIVLLEAMASGLPVAGHRFPVTEWIIGEGGTTIDMTEEGRLASVLKSWRNNSDTRRSLGHSARAHVVNSFASNRIISLYRNMYEAISGRKNRNS